MGGSRTVLSVGEKNIWLLHPSGKADRIPLSSFGGTMELEEFDGSTEEYLAWTQKDHIFAAVSRLNVVSFWNTFTGKLIHKKVLGSHAQIEDAPYFRAHDYQNRHQHPANQFDAFDQTIVSYAKDNDECYRVRIVKLEMTKDANDAFNVVCKTRCEARLSSTWIRSHDSNVSINA